MLLLLRTGSAEEAETNNWKQELSDKTLQSPQQAHLRMRTHTEDVKPAGPCPSVTLTLFMLLQQCSFRWTWDCWNVEKDVRSVDGRFNEVSHQLWICIPWVPWCCFSALLVRKIPFLGFKINVCHWLVNLEDLLRIGICCFWIKMFCIKMWVKVTTSHLKQNIIKLSVTLWNEKFQEYFTCVCTLGFG